MERFIDNITLLTHNTKVLDRPYELGDWGEMISLSGNTTAWYRQNQVGSSCSEIQEFLNGSKCTASYLVAKGVLLSAPVGILSPLHLSNFPRSRANKTNIFMLSDLSTVHILSNGCQCVHLFKTMPVVLFSIFFLNNNL